jgi:peptidoglycan/xylan/chitin deacetylase (PgdA/CDA1 family)
LALVIPALALVLLGVAVGFASWHGLWNGRAGLPAARAALFGPRVVAITVDDGPTPAYTPQVLALLERHHAVATFFVIGKAADRFPDLVLAEVAQGSTVGDHTWSHRSMDRVSSARTGSEILLGMQAVQRITGRVPLYYRPPRGVMTPAESRAVASLGMRTILWDACLDHEADKTPAAAAARVLAHVIPGDIILLHDGAGDRDKTMKALAILLDGLQARGYKVVPLDTLPL